MRVDWRPLQILDYIYMFRNSLFIELGKIIWVWNKLSIIYSMIWRANLIIKFTYLKMIYRSTMRKHKQWRNTHK